MSNSFFSNTIWGVTSNILQNVFLGIFFILLTKSIGLSKFSEYVIGNSLYQIVAAFSTMGLGNYFIREFVQKETNKNYSVLHFFVTEFILSLIGFIFIILLSIILYLDDKFIITVSVVLGINILFDNLIYSIKSIHLAENTQKIIVKITLLESFVKLILGFIYFYLPFDFVLFILILVFARILTLIQAFSSLSSVIKREILISMEYKILINVIKFKKIKYFIFKGRIFFIIGAVNIIFWRINSLLLSKLTSKIDVGLYEIAYKFFSIAQIIPVILLSTIYPIMAKHFSDKNTYLIISQKIYLQILIFSVYTTLFAYYLCPYFIEYFFGNDFKGSIILTQHMFFALIPFSLSLFQAYMLLSSNNEIIDMWLNIFNIFFNTILGYILIILTGSVGSVSSITISFCLFYILQAFILKRKKLDFLDKLKTNVLIILIIVFTTLFLSEYSILTDIHPIIILTLSVSLISIYAFYNGIFKKSILKYI